MAYTVGQKVEYRLDDAAWTVGTLLEVEQEGPRNYLWILSPRGTEVRVLEGARTRPPS